MCSVWQEYVLVVSPASALCTSSLEASAYPSCRTHPGHNDDKPACWLCQGTKPQWTSLFHFNLSSDLNAMTQIYPNMQFDKSEIMPKKHIEKPYPKIHGTRIPIVASHMEKLR